MVRYLHPDIPGAYEPNPGALMSYQVTIGPSQQSGDASVRFASKSTLLLADDGGKTLRQFLKLGAVRALHQDPYQRLSA
jgi:hypothetical protein